MLKSVTLLSDAATADPGVTARDLVLIAKAMNFAAAKHRDQRRKDAYATPYINHPIALFHILANEADVARPLVLSAALLHDTLEDTDTTPDELTHWFGPRVAQLVQEVTDDKQLRKAIRKQRQIERAMSLSHEARLITLADKISNVRDMHRCPPAGWELSRRREYFDWAKLVIDQIRGTHAVLEHLFDAAYTDKP